MVQQEDGKIIRKIEDVAAGDCIRVTLEDGYFNATVQNLKEYEA
jgi:exonuclease VII large subunit